MSFPPGTEMFQFPGFASRRHGFTTGYRSRGGLPHSEIPVSTDARSSTGLIAACHVLHRLLAPRHPPDALASLPSRPSHRRRPPPKERPSRARRGPQHTRAVNATDRADPKAGACP
jgi:hypothetical protein